MYTIRHTILGNIRALFMADAPSANPVTEDIGLAKTKEELKWLETTGNHTDKAQVIRALDRIRDAMKQVASRNETQKTSISTELDKALMDTS